MRQHPATDIEEDGVQTTVHREHISHNHVRLCNGQFGLENYVISLEDGSSDATTAIIIENTGHGTSTLDSQTY